MKTSLYLATGIIAGITAGVSFAIIYEGKTTTTSSEFNSDALDREIAELNDQLTIEQVEREAIRSELVALQQAITELQIQQDETLPIRDQLRERIEEVTGQELPENQEQLREEFSRFQRVSQEDRYVNAGISASRAQWIMQREEELELEMLQARYEATMNGEEGDLPDADDMLRKELGDDEYEKYLEANRRPTSIAVRDVMGSSPAELAGLRPGDEIVKYDGNRVFEMGELNEMTYNGKAGETVAVEVVREGQTMQVYIQRGPLGISGGGRIRGR